jgi:hypothetical protein
MPIYTHKARPIKELAPFGFEELFRTEQLPADGQQRKAIIDFIKKYTIDQGELYTATFKNLNFKEQAQSISGQIHSLEQSIQAHVSAKGKETLTRRIEQVREALERLEKVLEEEQAGSLADEQGN